MLCDEACIELYYTTAAAVSRMGNGSGQDAPRATEVKYWGRVLGSRPSPMLRAPTHGTVVGSPDQSLNVHSVFKPVWVYQYPSFLFST